MYLYVFRCQTASGKLVIQLGPSVFHFCPNAICQGTYWSCKVTFASYLQHVHVKKASSKQSQNAAT